MTDYNNQDLFPRTPKEADELKSPATEPSTEITKGGYGIDASRSGAARVSASRDNWREPSVTQIHGVEVDEALLPAQAEDQAVAEVTESAETMINRGLLGELNPAQARAELEQLLSATENGSPPPS